ncbi:hypothetical protein EZV62_025263 [Acer yangbiense]|uniref:non-specific serine/threonine protein kinase n=1 Tax=Acer yangbiense TaxID=1000413 RepID=A0A5C7GXC1_9ROSI|nr:hypothetical protein EZV62_025263 [Acer yangbiense]
MLAMEKDFDSKLIIEGNNSSNCPNVQRSKSFAFRAPQENFTIQDFELGKIYGVGSYSKLVGMHRSIFSASVNNEECGQRQVVRAKKKDSGTVYALKIMDKKFITKENKTAYVKLERIVLDQLDHPGVVRLFFTFQDTFSLYMALESCEGGELFDQITRKGRLSEDEARFYAAEVVDALEYIHSMGLIHRDIKPENLLLTTEGHIKIADFGSVKPMQDSRITVLPNAASDDKACTFVGTAAYVPPEVLNSSPATFGNDLWALGCTLYQMLSGTSPFKDASEWLIFQRIIARDIRFPDYFSAEARDLIDRLLIIASKESLLRLSVMSADFLQHKRPCSRLNSGMSVALWKDIDPSRRPGAGLDGYAVLKRHPFFKAVDWKNLRGETPPKLASEPTSHSSEGDDGHDSSWNPSHIGDGSARQNDGNGGGASSSEASSITRLASIDSFDSKWQQFLDPGESVLMIAMVKKLQKLTSKKVQLILTNKPKLIYVDPSKLMIKGNIIWSNNSNDLSIQVTSPSNFKIVTVLPLCALFFSTANTYKSVIHSKLLQ